MVSAGGSKKREPDMFIRYVHNEREFLLEAEEWVPQPLDAVFSFFADAHNLEILTPPFLKFQVDETEKIQMRPGIFINYKLRLRGVPLRWRSEITVWDPPYRFVDEQRRGPYRYWIHEHRFEAKDGGTSVKDRVRYSVFGGRVVERLFVRRDLKMIFEYRKQQMQQLFNGA
jgi:ligand-binding SRPBCC domain-containing protein